MGDALCGPSNPLQNFRKQTQLDRTLQQNRLVGPRSSAAQGFRSHDPRTGSLDADLHAFEHSGPNPASLQLQHPAPSQAAFPYPGGAAGWASDFQKLHISHPSTPVSITSPHQPQLSGWGSEFMMHAQNQRIGTPQSDLKGKQAIHEPPIQGGLYNTAAYYDAPMYQPQMQAPPNFSLQYQQPQQAPLATQEPSQLEFEAAFAEAFKHSEAQMLEQPEQEHYNANGFEIDPLQQQAPIGSDAIHYVEQADRTTDQNVRDADELARTAGELLRMVQHDSSEKMRNSQFLGLMRKIRDREVEVQDNELQSTATRGYMEDESGFIPLQNAGLAAHSSGQEVSAQYSTGTAETEADGRTEPQTDSNSSEFKFPDMNAVYAYQLQTPPQPSISKSSNDVEMEMYSAHDDEYPSLAQDFQASSHTPTSQIQALHPGGKWYPEQKSPALQKANMSAGAEAINASASNDHMMSGAAMTNLMNIGTGPGAGISVDDFEKYDESPALGRPYAQES